MALRATGAPPGAGLATGLAKRPRRGWGPGSFKIKLAHGREPLPGQGWPGAGSLVPRSLKEVP